VYCPVVSDGTSSIDLEPLALIARLARSSHLLVGMSSDTRGSSPRNSSLRSQIVPSAVATPEEKDKPSLPLSHYISWSDLLRKTFAIDTICPRCKSPLRLIALIETEDTITKSCPPWGYPPRRPNLGPPDASVSIWRRGWRLSQLTTRRPGRME